MILIYRFFKLPIYRRSYKKYYQDAEKDKEKNIKLLESSWQKPYDQISDHVKRDMENSHEWPPWEFNDIIGFVDIGMDAADRLTGNIFLMRKYLRKDHHKNYYRKYHTPSEKQQIYYFRELDPHKVNWHDNASYIEGINQLLDEATKAIQALSKTRKHKWILQKLSFSLECIDFVKLASEINQNFPKKVYE